MTNEDKYISALAKIKVMIDDYYGEVGRSDGDIIDTDALREDLISRIDDLLFKMKLPSKYLISEKYESEKDNDDTMP